MSPYGVFREGIQRTVHMLSASGNSPCLLSRFRGVRLFATPWTAAHQAPLSVGFSREKKYWSGLPCPSPGDLPHPVMEPECLALAGGFFTTSDTWEAPRNSSVCVYSGGREGVCAKLIGKVIHCGNSKFKLGGVGDGTDPEKVR